MLTLEQDCTLWADAHWPECHVAMSTGDRRHFLKCCGAVVRKRTQSDGFDWLYARIAWDPDEVLRLSPYVGGFEAFGIAVPGDIGWRDYCRGVSAIETGPRIPISYLMAGEKNRPDMPSDSLDMPARRGNVAAPKKAGAGDAPSLFG